MKFLQLFRNYIEYHRTTPGPERRKKGTIQVYEVKYKMVNLFLYEKSIVNINCNDFDNSVCEQLIGWMEKKKHSNNKKNYTKNYIIRIVEICQEVLDFGVDKRFIKRSNCYSFKMVRDEPKEPIYLSPEQIKAFENYTSSSSLKMKAAIMFVITIHTGFDYGDFAELRKFHRVTYKGRDYLIKPRHKNGIKQIIPISPKLDELLELYNYDIRLLSNTKFNEYIKIVAAELNIDIYLTTKDGRKIFFMNKLNNEGYSMEASSKIGGHKTTYTTEKYYAQVNVNLISKEMDRLGIKKQLNEQPGI